MAEWRQLDGAFVARGADLAPDVELLPGAVIHEGVRVGPGSRIGSAAVLHAGTAIGAGCLVEDTAVLGKRPRLRRGSNAAGVQLGNLELSNEVTVCAGAVVYAGASIGAHVIIGDQTQVRELAVVGERSVVGRGSCVDFAVRIGARVLIQTDVYVTGGSVVEDDVFIGPGVVMTNDDAMGRHAADEPLRGPILRRACRVGGGVVLTPGVEIGEEAFIGSGAVITRNVGAREVVVGLPGRVIRRVEDEDLLERWT